LAIWYGGGKPEAGPAAWRAFPNRSYNRRPVSFGPLPLGARVTIYSILGRKVAGFYALSEGEFWSWDLRDWEGIPCAGGVHLFSVQTPHERHTGKFLILK